MTHVSTLDLDSLPMERISKLWLDLSEDALGRPISVPVLVARGRRPGPVLGMTAVVHGNEINGIPVIHRLFERVDLQALKGSIVAVVVVNVVAFDRQTRLHPDGKDLNHMFAGGAEATESKVLAERLLERVIRHVDVLLDLHTAGSGRANTYYVRADMTKAATARLAYLQRPQIIAHKPAMDGTLRGAAEGMGIPSVTLEIGDAHRFQPRYIRRALAGVRAVLAAWRFTVKRPAAAIQPPVLCGSSRWLYTDRGGLLRVLPALMDRVEKGEVIARLTDAFGDLVCEYSAPSDGIVIGHSVDPVARTGARILHLGRLEGTEALIDQAATISPAQRSQA